jgi:steroid delta-isomerase-like uncharacterized protein
MELQTKVSAEDVVRKFLDAGNRHNLDAIAATLDPNYVDYSPMSPPANREAELKELEAMFKASSDIEIRILNIAAKDEEVAVEFSYGGTFNGPLELGGQTIPATGRHFELKQASFFRVNSRGLIEESRDYYDSAALLRQLGVKA